MTINFNWFIREKRIYDVRFLNKYFENVNKTLKYGLIFKGNVEIYSIRRERILKKNLDLLIEYTYFLTYFK